MYKDYLNKMIQYELDRKADESGFFDLPKPKRKDNPLGGPNYKRCNSPEHKAPTHIYIPSGKGYRHVCPSCGHVEVVISPEIRFINQQP